MDFFNKLAIVFAGIGVLGLVFDWYEDTLPTIVYVFLLLIGGIIWSLA